MHSSELTSYNNLHCKHQASRGGTACLSDGPITLLTMVFQDTLASANLRLVMLHDQ